MEAAATKKRAMVSGPKTLRSLLNLFKSDEQGAQKPATIRKVRSLYRYGKVSRGLFDAAFRMLLNFGNWVQAVGLGLRSGFLTFGACRDRFAKEARMRPPIHISDARARKDVADLIAEGKVVWRD